SVLYPLVCPARILIDLDDRNLTINHDRISRMRHAAGRREVLRNAGAEPDKRRTVSDREAHIILQTIKLPSSSHGVDPGYVAKAPRNESDSLRSRFFPCGVHAKPPWLDLQ